MPSSVMFIERGSIEVYSILEGNEFVFDRLLAGSIINHRVLFLKDLVYVNFRAEVQTTVLYIDE